MICIASAGQAASGEGERHHCQGSGRDTKIKVVKSSVSTVNAGIWEYFFTVFWIRNDFSDPDPNPTVQFVPDLNPVSDPTSFSYS
jgi:hypothetical protein